GLRGLSCGILGGFLGLRNLGRRVLGGLFGLRVVFGLSVVIACGLLSWARVEAPGSVLFVVGLRRARSARFRRLLGFGLRGLRRVGLGRSLRRRLRGVSIIGRGGGRLAVVIAGRVVDFGVVGDDLEAHLRGVGLGLEVGEVERVLPDGDLGILGHGEVVRAGHLALLIDRELLLR